MKRKPAKRSKAASKPAASNTSQPSEPPVVNVVHLEMPPPEILLEEAEREPNFRDLSPYCPVIATLRGKGFSYREIAEWLSERGVDVDHNAVYRVYLNSLSKYEAAIEEKEIDEEAQEEAYRNR